MIFPSGPMTTLRGNSPCGSLGLDGVASVVAPAEPPEALAPGVLAEPLEAVTAPEVAAMIFPSGPMTTLRGSSPCGSLGLDGVASVVAPAEPPEALAPGVLAEPLEAVTAPEVAAMIFPSGP